MKLLMLLSMILCPVLTNAAACETNPVFGADFISQEQIGEATPIVTRIHHQKSGKEEKFPGCPHWSPDGKSFVSLSELGTEGATKNGTQLWRCAKPAEACKKTWSSKKAGHAVQWTGPKVEITLSENREGTKLQKIHCAPSDEGAFCETKLPNLPAKKKNKR